MTYPVLFIRIKAMMIDSIILALLFFVMVFLSMALEITDAKLKASFILLPIILIEPLMVWITGGSFGHHYSGIRIVGKNSEKNLFILNGIVRFFAKTFLGAFSLASMFITKRHQSIHDFLSHSVVVFKNEAVVPSRHKLKPREVLYTAKKPSISRRLVVVIAYLVIAFLILSISINFLVSMNCLESNQCNQTDSLNLGFASLSFIVIALMVLILGFFSKLPGAYYRAKK